MQRFLFLFLSSILLLQCQTASDEASGDSAADLVVKRQPAEYDPQAAVWLIWSPVDHLEGYSNEEVTLSMIEALVPHTKVIVSAANDTLLQRAQARIPSDYLEQGKVGLVQLASEELWVRDMGPNFVELEDGRMAVADFAFDAWGYTPIDAMDEYTIRMEKYDELVAERRNLPLISSDMISEGGNREVNGEGTLLVVESVEKGRNPNMSKAEMEAEFSRLLGVKKVIWLKEGLHEDDHTFRGTLSLEDGSPAYTVVTTNGHIDEFARFVDDNTILLATVDTSDLHDPIAQENLRRMEENYQILKEATDQDGKPFEIIRVPLPHLLTGKMKPGDSVYDFISELDYEDGSTFPKGDTVTVIAAASYLNFLITDEVVLAQKYWKEGMDLAIKERDEEVIAILQSVFPKRKIVALDALAVNFGGGGIHCISMQEPMIGEE